MSPVSYLLASDSPHGADSPTEVTAITNPEQPVSPQTSAAITRSYSQYSVHALTLLSEVSEQVDILVTYVETRLSIRKDVTGNCRLKKIQIRHKQ